MKYATPRQKKWVTDLIRQKKLTSEQLQMLREARLLDAVFTAASLNQIETINPFELRKVLGLEELYFIPWGPRFDFEVQPIDVPIGKLLEEWHIADTDVLLNAPGEEKTRIPKKTEMRLFAVNCSWVSGGFDVLKQNRIAGAGAAELASFGYKFVELPTDLHTLRVIGLGCCFNPAANFDCQSYPCLEYECGLLRRCSRVSNITNLNNGGEKESKQRDLFLGFHLKSRL